MIKRILIVIISSIILASLGVMPVLADGSDLTTIECLEDEFYNYDFTDDEEIGDEDYVDQPATILFCGDANVSDVKDAFYYDGFIYAGSTMHNELDDGSGWTYDGDSGRKTDWTDWDGDHFRVYAADGVDMNNALWDDYVVGTTHRDYWPYYGWSEDCEDLLCELADEKEGWTVYEDYLYFYNYDGGFWEGNQWWECDGYASKIVMP